VSDRTSTAEPYDTPTVAFDSGELTLGEALPTSDYSVVIPCRTEMRSSQVELFTTGPGELNIKWMEYVGRFFPKIRRR
jgi:hypothetical protein